MPTAAALALALAGLGCSGTEEGTPITADFMGKAPVTHAAEPASSGPGSGGEADLAPEPVAVPGQAAMVLPVPPPVPPTTVKVPPVAAPSTKPIKLGGKPMAVHPSI